MSFCNDKIPAFNPNGCSMPKSNPVLTIQGDILKIDGVYRGHITAIKDNSIEIEYLGDNKYMKGQKTTLHMNGVGFNKLN